jgi:hypothetical protein
VEKILQRGGDRKPDTSRLDMEFLSKHGFGD